MAPSQAHPQLEDDSRRAVTSIQQQQLPLLLLSIRLLLVLLHKQQRTIFTLYALLPCTKNISQKNTSYVLYFDVRTSCYILPRQTNLKGYVPTWCFLGPVGQSAWLEDTTAEPLRQGGYMVLRAWHVDCCRLRIVFWQKILAHPVQKMRRDYAKPPIPVLYGDIQ